MVVVRVFSCLLGLVLVFLATPVVHALDDSGAKVVISQFLTRQNNNQGTPSANRHTIADLNGDGRPDIVLYWDVLGPTSAFPKLTLFLDQGKNYRVLTTDLWGQIENLTVKGPNIIVDTLALGPNDARCCPSVKKQLRYRWTGAKLARLQ